MKWTIRKTYLYLISLITFIMSIVGFWTLTSNAVELLWPVPSYRLPCETLITLDYWDKELSEAERQAELARCEADADLDEARQLAYRRQGLAKSFLFLLIVVPSFVYHWRQANRAEAEGI